MTVTAVEHGGDHGCLHTSKPRMLRNSSFALAITIITNQDRGRYAWCVRVCRRRIPELGESERLHRGRTAKQNSLRGLCRESGGPYLLSLGPCW